MVPREAQTVHVLLIQEDGGYTAQMLEMDFAARGRTETEALQCLGRTLIGQARLDQKHGRRPFVGTKPAPTRFWDRWRELALLSDDTPHSDIPPAYVVNAALKASSFQLSW